MKEGDVVTISPDLEDLKTANKPYPFWLSREMLNLRGKQAEITSVRTDFYHSSRFPDYPDLDGNIYHIDLDNGSWSWTNIMFKESAGLKIVEE